MNDKLPSPEGDSKHAEASATHDKSAQKDKTKIPSFERGTFNIGQFRLDQSFAEHAGGEKLLTTVPVRKPGKEVWFRTHPDQDFRLATPVIELKDQKETYLVARPLWEELMGEPTFVKKLLIPAITRQGDLFLWPIRLPSSDGSLDDWNQSALEAAREASTRWTRLVSNMSLGAYVVIVGPDPQKEPTWPDKSLEEIVMIAFKNRIIETLDHPVIRQLRGL
jgi:hypothetical protein